MLPPPGAPGPVISALAWESDEIIMAAASFVRSFNKYQPFICQTELWFTSPGRPGHSGWLKDMKVPLPRYGRAENGVCGVASSELTKASSCSSDSFFSSCMSAGVRESAEIGPDGSAMLTPERESGGDEVCCPSPIIVPVTKHAKAKLPTTAKFTFMIKSLLLARNNGSKTAFEARFRVVNKFLSYQVKIASEKNTVLRRWLDFIVPVFLLTVASQYQHRKTLGETIRSRRTEAGLSQEKLAEKADLHHNYIGELERGEKAATIDTLLKIAKALKLRVRDLVANI